MKAPPRSMFAPELFTARATLRICSSDSTEQGPAIRTGFPPPMVTPPTVITVFSGWNLRLAFL